ncbi:MAG: HDOD domain-containing protein [Lentisphaerales bacterium]|nr:HDOD domain-containing protein [Lentisphaerales bacterium]
MNTAARNLVDQVKKLGTLPTVYTKVNELVNDPNCPASKLGDAISNDQVITSMILKLVNSALYGFPNYIDTVTKAVTIIGFKQTRDLVLASSVIDMFKNGKANEFIDLQGFWKHSIAAAISAKALAGHISKSDPEAMFTAGLLHDIGRLIMLEFTDKLPLIPLIQKCKEREILVYKNERKVLGFTHMDVADALFYKWNLPPVLKEAAVFHHAPQMAPRFKEEACCIHIADAIAHALQLGNSTDLFVPVIHEESWESLGIPLDKLPVVIRQVNSSYPDLVKIFFKE